MDESLKQSRYMWMTGTQEYTHKITLAGEYNINKHFNVSGQLAYTFIINNYNISDNPANGFEIALAVQYKLFE
jgi:hypothetical protein